MHVRASALLLLLPQLAMAQSWRADLGGIDQNALVLMCVVGAGLGYFHIRAAYARSADSGSVAVMVCTVLAVLIVVFPAARAVLALVTAAFLIYGFFNRT